MNSFIPKLQFAQTESQNQIEALSSMVEQLLEE